MLTLSGGLLALGLAARPADAATPLSALVWLKLPDLVIEDWSIGQMWSTATNSSVPAVIATVKNTGNGSSAASTTRITHNGNTFNFPTPVLSPGQSHSVAAPLTNGSVCGILSVQVDANNNNVEWSEANSFAVVFDCFPPPGP
jgi:subtilase family serine protease